MAYTNVAGISYLWLVSPDGQIEKISGKDSDVRARVQELIKQGYTGHESSDTDVAASLMGVTPESLNDIAAEATATEMISPFQEAVSGLTQYTDQISPLSIKDVDYSQFGITAPESITGQIQEAISPFSSALTGQSQQAFSDLDALQAQAQSTELSPFAQAQMEMQGLEQQQQLQDVSKAGAGALQSGFNQLAAVGGLESGARERLASQNVLDRMKGSQDVRSTGAQTRLGIQASDLANKQALLESLPSQRLGLASQYATTGANLQSPFLQQLQTEQQQAFDVNQYNQNLGLQGAIAAQQNSIAEQQNAQDLGLQGVQSQLDLAQLYSNILGSQKEGAAIRKQ